LVMSSSIYFGEDPGGQSWGPGEMCHWPQHSCTSDTNFDLLRGWTWAAWQR
jgi:hypothetical protein